VIKYGRVNITRGWMHMGSYRTYVEGGREEVAGWGSPPDEACVH